MVEPQSHVLLEHAAREELRHAIAERARHGLARDDPRVTELVRELGVVLALVEPRIRSS
jgi:hypothetical protein